LHDILKLSAIASARIPFFPSWSGFAFTISLN
jgi:hypothetical protein